MHQDIKLTIFTNHTYLIKLIKIPNMIILKLFIEKVLISHINIRASLSMRINIIN